VRPEMSDFAFSGRMCKVWAVHSGRPHSRGRRFVQCGHFMKKGEGIFRCGRPHLLMQKTSDFSKFMVCPHGQGGLSQCGQGERKVNFISILCGRLFTFVWRSAAKHDSLFTRLPLLSFSLVC